MEAMKASVATLHFIAAEHVKFWQTGGDITATEDFCCCSCCVCGTEGILCVYFLKILLTEIIAFSWKTVSDVELLYFWLTQRLCIQCDLFYTWAKQNNGEMDWNCLNKTQSGKKLCIKKHWKTCFVKIHVCHRVGWMESRLQELLMWKMSAFEAVWSPVIVFVFQMANDFRLWVALLMASPWSSQNGNVCSASFLISPRSHSHWDTKIQLHFSVK